MEDRVFQYRIGSRRFVLGLASAVMALASCAVGQGSIVSEKMTPREFPFVNGSMLIPAPPGINNPGVITDQTVPGQTHVEAYLFWRLLEPEQGRWNLEEADRLFALGEKRGMKILAFPWLMYAPEWFKRTDTYTPLVDMIDGRSPDMLSPWAPGTLWAYDHFYSEMAKRYGRRWDIILVGLPSSDYGEAGYPMGAGGFASEGTFRAFFPQEPDAWHAGYWCGDKYARADFRRRMLRKYRSVAGINKAWNTSFRTNDDIAFADPDKRMSCPRRWLDFVSWLNDSQVRVTRRILSIVRRHFPSAYLEVALGCASDLALFGVDRSALCRAVADFQPAAVRSTHACYNRDFPRAYWFYKRMSPVCHQYGIGFGTEPPGGDLTYDELRRQYFEDASAGTNLFYSYYQNFHLRPNVVRELKAVFRPNERSMVDIGVLFPSTQTMLDVVHFPEGQLEFCAKGREFFDYDVVDENMISWGMLRNYRVLVHTSGSTFERSSLRALERWVRGGGVLITRGTPRWCSVEGEKCELADAPGSGRFGKGRVYAVDAASDGDFVTRVTELLTGIRRESKGGLHGFDGKDDGTYTTEFPSGLLLFDTKTLTTRFAARP